MISIVICHGKTQYLQSIQETIKKTIGVPYELIIIENYNNQYSIFEAYNLGASKSQYPIICFSHDDLEFHTENWGQKVIDHFKDLSIGMIGVVGGNVFPKSPAPWWSSTLVNDHLVNNIQHWHGPVSHNEYQKIISKNNQLTVTHQYNNPQNKNVVDAVVLDGLWFCIRKQLFDQELIRFDTKTFKAFHRYDFDISLQVKQYARVCVVYDILMEHFSEGSMLRDWFESLMDLNRKWRDKLPISTKEIDKSKYPLYEWETLRTFIYWAGENGRLTEKEIRDVILEIYPTLPNDKSNRIIYIELVSRAKFGRNISRVLTQLYKLI